MQYAGCGKQFRTVLTDPPWPGQPSGRHYPVMSLEQTRWLSVASLVRVDVYSWLRMTNGLLREAYEVAEAWGLTVRSPLMWVKFRLGLGGRYFLCNATKQLLFCTRDRESVNLRSQPTQFTASVREHSRRPAEQFTVTERMSQGPSLELFAHRRPGSRADWPVWGNQVDADVVIPDYPVPSGTPHDQDGTKRLREIQ